MTRCFLDTCVFVRTRDEASSAREQRSAALWFLALPDREFRTSPLVLGQIFASIVDRRSKETRERTSLVAREVIFPALAIADAAFDRPAVILAMEIAARPMGFWDATNWASAIQDGCDEYASFDAPGLPHLIRGVRYVNPLQLWRAAGRPEPFEQSR